MDLLAKLSQKGKHCCGCASCANICPTDAIVMIEDKLGFWKPNIDAELCIECGLCEEHCPELNAPRNTNTLEPECIAVAADDQVRFHSSSGGAFSVFAEYVLKNGGMVCGAAWGSELSVSHRCVKNTDELWMLRKSKYVQSNPELVHRQIKEALEDGQQVLFSGCPCQVAGLNAFLDKAYDNLVTVDIFCHGVPSQKMLRESLNGLFSKKTVKTVDFRDKNYGWECLAMTVRFEDGKKQRLSYDESRYEQGFHPGMTLNESCYDCEFCDFPRAGDISIGDFWRLEEFDFRLVDGKGTSVLLLNSQKGKDLFEATKEAFFVCQQVPIEYLRHNRIHPVIEKDAGREHFLALYPQRDFNQSVLYAQQNKFDVALVGNWSYPNYGSEFTYYALYRVLKEMGLSACMISWPKSSHWKPYDTPQLFLNNPYEQYEVIPPVETREDMWSLSQRSETFLLGSDQLLNDNLYNWFDRFMQLDWVKNNQRKIAYATSFGTDYIWGSDENRAELSHFLKQFDFVSVREKSAKSLLDQHYGVKADCVLDPVFLLPEKELNMLVQTGKPRIQQNRFMFAYVLDAEAGKEQILTECSKRLNLEICAVSDAAPPEHTLQEHWNIPTQYNVKLEEWLAYICESELVITDSFHGTCAAILYKKPFVSICNPTRGATRFMNLLSMLGLEDRLINEVGELKSKEHLLFEPIDYASVEQKLDLLRQSSKQWLEHALFAQLEPKPLTDFDLLMPRILGINNELRGCVETNKSQWQQLEDHRLRLDGVDDTNKNQWQQLEDHRLRLDGVEDTNKNQWQQLEDHRLRMDGSDAQIKELQQQIEVLSKIVDEQSKTIEAMRRVLKLPLKIDHMLKR